MASVKGAVAAALRKPVTLAALPPSLAFIVFWFLHLPHLSREELNITLTVLIQVETTLLAVGYAVAAIIAGNIGVYIAVLESLRLRWLDSIASANDEWRSLVQAAFVEGSAAGHSSIANLDRDELRRYAPALIEIRFAKNTPPSATRRTHEHVLQSDAVTLFRISGAIFFSEFAVERSLQLTEGLAQLDHQHNVVLLSNHVSNVRLAMRRGIPTLVGLLLIAIIAAVAALILNPVWLAGLAVLPLPAVVVFAGLYVDEIKRLISP